MSLLFTSKIMHNARAVGLSSEKHFQSCLTLFSVVTPVEMTKSLISVLNAVTRDIYQKLGFLMLNSER